MVDLGERPGDLDGGLLVESGCVDAEVGAVDGRVAEVGAVPSGGDGARVAEREADVFVRGEVDLSATADELEVAGGTAEGRRGEVVRAANRRETAGRRSPGCAFGERRGECLQRAVDLAAELSADDGVGGE